MVYPTYSPRSPATTVDPATAPNISSNIGATLRALLNLEYISGKLHLISPKWNGLDTDASRDAGMTTYAASSPMTRFVLLLMCDPLLTAPSLSIPKTIGDYFLDKGFWEHVSWDSIDGSALARADGWTKTGASRTTSLLLFGNEWHAEIRHGKVPVVRLETKSLPKSGCDRLLKEFSARFGVPSFAEDGLKTKFSDTKYMKMVWLAYQWDIGGTRINGGCDANIDQDSENMAVYNWSVTYFPLDGISKLVPSIALRCYEKTDNTDSGEIAVIVDFDVDLVKRADGTAFSDPKTFFADDNEIRFDGSVYPNDAPRIIIKYLISRVTGDLHAEYENRGHSKIITGHCEKVDRLENRF
jgi:hypothetical protein